MKRLNFEGPINSLSLGNVTVNFLRELKEKDLEISFFPIGDKGDFSAYDKIPKDFQQWVSNISATRLKKLDKNTPSLKVWHINGSEKVLPNQFLYVLLKLY